MNWKGGVEDRRWEKRTKGLSDLIEKGGLGIKERVLGGGVCMYKFLV